MHSYPHFTIAIGLSLLLFFQGHQSYGQGKKVEWAAVPAPSYNEVQGLGITLTGGLFYQLNAKDTISEPSSTFVYGFYSENKTWIGAFLQEGYFNKNKYWFDVLGVIGDYRFTFYPTNDIEELKDFRINYATDIRIVKINFLRKVWRDIYLGLHYKYSSFNTTFDIGGQLPEGIDIPNYSDHSQYSGLGIKVAYDSRDHRLNPSTGFLMDVFTSHFREALTSDANFDVVEASFNNYRSLKSNHILATRFYCQIGVGDVPFEEQAILGFAGERGKDVRGYSSGRYRGNQLYDIQAEWRWNFYKKWGMVAFGSLSLIGNDAEQIESNGLLPAIGAGIRFVAAKEKNVNIGLDIAKGKNDYGIYFAISEAF